MKALCASWIVLPVVLLLLSSSSSSSSSVVTGLKSVLSREYVHFYYPATWETARHICRRYYTELATFYSEEDVKDLYLEQYIAWIGLGGDRDQWSDLVLSNGKAYFLKLRSDQTDVLDKAECAAATRHVYYYNRKPLINRIYGLNCESYHYFICEDIKNSNTEYVFIPKAMSWTQAQQYCKDQHDDLANIDASDLDDVVGTQDFPVWIGLHRDGGSWNWTVGSSEGPTWSPDEPSSSGDCVYIQSANRNMATQNCDTHFPFLCIGDNVVLVKEEKSWEEALEHCRGLRSSYDDKVRYDLLSLQPDEEYAYVMTKVLEADTAEVWIGLRFLAGDWLWVNGADMLYSGLPVCPAPGQRCGILSNGSAGSVEARDCSEGKNFLCYSYTP